MLQDIFGASSLPSGPTSKQTNTSSIQPWAQPYISDYLTKAQALANQGPNAAQQQVYSAAQNLQTPGQFAQGSNLLNQAGQGQLGTVNQALGYGAQGAGYGQQATQAGANYQQMATDPNAIAAYMNPYIQQSLAPQLALLNQQQALAGQGIAAKAVGQGAFGGNRATLAQGLNAQNFDLARQQAIGQGYNQAFQNAQQAQQFGANLGLQGLATGIQGAGMGLQGVQGAQQGYTGAAQAGAGLGTIGAQQGQYGLGALALQNQIANQQYAQPWLNLQNMQGMMSGLPISTQTTQGYQAPPNALSQIAGLGTSLLGGYGLYKNLTSGNKTAPVPGITNPYAGSIESGGAKTGEVWGSPGNQDATYGNTDTSSVMRGSFNPAEEWDTSPSTPHLAVEPYAFGGQIRSYASGGLVALALDNALKG